MSSGASVPLPRTWRSISPRFTVSIPKEALSTTGAAGWEVQNTRSFAGIALTSGKRSLHQPNQKLFPYQEFSGNRFVIKRSFGYDYSL